MTFHFKKKYFYTSSALSPSPLKESSPIHEFRRYRGKLNNNRRKVYHGIEFGTYNYPLADRI